MKIKRSISLVFCLFLANNSFASNEYTYQDIRGPLYRFLPAGHVFLEDASTACGSGFTYAVKNGLYTKQQIEWLRATLKFLYGGKRSAFEQIDFELVTENPISDKEFNQLLRNSEFSSWAGTKLVSLIERLQHTRNRLYANAKQMPKDHRVFFKHPMVENYIKAQKNLLSHLKNKFKVLETESGADCD